jgi:hypothetical protein
VPCQEESGTASIDPFFLIVADVGEGELLLADPCQFAQPDSAAAGVLVDSKALPQTGTTE